MRFLLAGTALAAMFAVPALAAGTTSQTTAGQSGSGQTVQMQAMSQDKLRSTLEQAGFQDIQIIDAAYLVRAQSPDGDQVMMFLNPPASATQAGMQGSGSQAGSSGTMQQQAAAQQTDRMSASGTGGQMEQSYRSFKQANIQSSSPVVGDMTADEVIGKEVVDQSDSQLGTVHDLLVGQGDRVEAALIDTGDSSYVAVQANKLQIEEGSGGQLLLDMSESELGQQPTFKQQGQSWERASSQ